jgi:ElaB/YqjD/DUF883 family membrane-anchored ribosome-binding protein
MATTIQNSTKDLRKDLYAVARDAEALIKATAGVTSERIQEARERAEETLRSAQDKLFDRKLRGRVRKLARNADGYVRDHSWTLIGSAATAGLLIGLLLKRR